MNKPPNEESRALGFEHVVAEIQAWAASEPLVASVFVYGSRARGDYRIDSDLDLAVGIRPVLDESELSAFLFEKDNLVESLQARLPLEVHLEWLGGRSKVAPGVDADGILLFRREEPPGVE